MNANQEARLNMYRATEKHCDNNTATIDTIKAFKNSFSAFKEQIAAIIASAQQEDLVIKGITVDKSEAKKILCTDAANIAAPIFAYASQSANNQLKQEVNFTYTDLFKTKDDQLAPRCQNIYTAGKDNLAALSEYGITDIMLNSLQSLITEYQAKVPNPRNAAAQKKTIRSNQKALFKSADNILKEQMDKTVIGFKSSNPDFVSSYYTNRIIIDPSKTTTTLKGTITSAIDNSFISNATITLANSTFKATTNTLGQFEIKPLQPNTYIVTIQAKGFLPKEIPSLEIKLGQITRLNTSLTPEA